MYRRSTAGFGNTPTAPFGVSPTSAATGGTSACTDKVQKDSHFIRPLRSTRFSTAANNRPLRSTRFKGAHSAKSNKSSCSAAGSAATATRSRSTAQSKMSAKKDFHRCTELVEIGPRQSVVPQRLGEEFVVTLLSELEEEVEEDDSFKTRLRFWLAHLILNQRFETGIGVVILSNFVVIALETDIRARRDGAPDGSSERETASSMLGVITVAHLVYLLTYTVECIMRLFVLRLEFFNNRWNNFDLAVVVSGLAAEIFTIVHIHSAAFDSLDGLRTIRIIRMVRATRVLVCFDELYSLVAGLSHAMKALMWAGILMLMALTVWSIIAVEFVKPLMSETALNNGFGTCTWCPSAFDNIFLSNLTWFQIISGDGWSHLARPLIEKYSWTAALFVVVIFTMVFGLLNLIVAVIVDSAVQAREADVMTMAARKDAVRNAAWDCFNIMVGELDKDGDGEISVNELRDGLSGDRDGDRLGAYLTTMGIEMNDLDMVFELLDEDGDGIVSHEEFTHQLYQMKTMETPITLCYIRSDVSHLHQELAKRTYEIQEKLDKMLSFDPGIMSGSIDSEGFKNEVPLAFPKAMTPISSSTVAAPAMGGTLSSNHEMPEKAQVKPTCKRMSIFGDKKRGSLFHGSKPLDLPKGLPKTGPQPPPPPNQTGMAAAPKAGNPSAEVTPQNDFQMLHVTTMEQRGDESFRISQVPGFDLHNHEEHEEEDEHDASESNGVDSFQIKAASS